MDVVSSPRKSRAKQAYKSIHETDPSMFKYRIMNIIAEVLSIIYRVLLHRLLFKALLKPCNMPAGLDLMRFEVQLIQNLYL